MGMLLAARTRVCQSSRLNSRRHPPPACDVPCGRSLASPRPCTPMFCKKCHGKCSFCCDETASRPGRTGQGRGSDGPLRPCHTPSVLCPPGAHPRTRRHGLPHVGRAQAGCVGGGAAHAYNDILPTEDRHASTSGAHASRPAVSLTGCSLPMTMAEVVACVHAEPCLTASIYIMQVGNPRVQP